VRFRRRSPVHFRWHGHGGRVRLPSVFQVQPQPRSNWAPLGTLDWLRNSNAFLPRQPTPIGLPSGLVRLTVRFSSWTRRPARYARRTHRPVRPSYNSSSAIPTSTRCTPTAWSRPFFQSEAADPSESLPWPSIAASPVSNTSQQAAPEKTRSNDRREPKRCLRGSARKKRLSSEELGQVVPTGEESRLDLYDALEAASDRSVLYQSTLRFVVAQNLCDLGWTPTIIDCQEKETLLRIIGIYRGLTPRIFIVRIGNVKIAEKRRPCVGQEIRPRTEPDRWNCWPQAAPRRRRSFRVETWMGNGVVLTSRRRWPARWPTYRSCRLWPGPPI